MLDRRPSELILEAREALALLTSLKPGQRRVLALAAAGYRYREMAQLLGITYTKVNRDITEGRAAARALRDAA